MATKRRIPLSNDPHENRATTEVSHQGSTRAGLSDSEADARVREADEEDNQKNQDNAEESNVRSGP